MHGQFTKQRQRKRERERESAVERVCTTVGVCCYVTYALTRTHQSSTDIRHGPHGSTAPRTSAVEPHDNGYACHPGHQLLAPIFGKIGALLMRRHAGACHVWTIGQLDKTSEYGSCCAGDDKWVEGGACSARAAVAWLHTSACRGKSHAHMPFCLGACATLPFFCSPLPPHPNKPPHTNRMGELL